MPYMLHLEPFGSSPIGVNAMSYGGCGNNCLSSLLDIRVPYSMRNMNATAVEMKPYSGYLSSVGYAGKQTTAIMNQRN